MRYWLSVFTVETWNEFKSSGAAVSGHSMTRWASAQRVRPGDRFLCYLAKAKRWIAVLEVTGPAYIDETEENRIWQRGLYPVRVPVSLVQELTPETGVPVAEMIGQLEAYQDHGSEQWGYLFQASLRQWSQNDGATVEAAISEAVQNPIHRELPRAATRTTRTTAVETESGPVTIPDDDPNGAGESDGSSDDEGSEHTRAQMILARLGVSMGYDVYVPAADRSKTYRGEQLGDIPMIEDLRLPLIPAAMRIIKYIDVLWIDRDAVQAAFEVEKSTSIFSGILRMTDLLALQPNLQIQCFLVAPDDRQSKVVEQVNRPTFARMRRPFSEMCRFIPFSALEDASESERTWRHLRFSYVVEDLAESVQIEVDL